MTVKERSVTVKERSDVVEAKVVVKEKTPEEEQVIEKSDEF